MPDLAPNDERRVMTPISRWFTLLEHFYEVPLPDGRQFSLVGAGLMEKRDGRWARSNISVNELLESTSGLSAELWRDLLWGCSGDESAEQWREKILTFRPPQSH